MPLARPGPQMAPMKSVGEKRAHPGHKPELAPCGPGAPITSQTTPPARSAGQAWRVTTLPAPPPNKLQGLHRHLCHEILQTHPRFSLITNLSEHSFPWHSGWVFRLCVGLSP